jgi:hypothetical protein
MNPIVARIAIAVVRHKERCFVNPWKIPPVRAEIARLKNESAHSITEICPVSAQISKKPSMKSSAASKKSVTEVVGSESFSFKV